MALPDMSQKDQTPSASKIPNYTDSTQTISEPSSLKDESQAEISISSTYQMEELWYRIDGFEMM